MYCQYSFLNMPMTLNINCHLCYLRVHVVLFTVFEAFTSLSLVIVDTALRIEHKASCDSTYPFMLTRERKDCWHRVGFSLAVTSATIVESLALFIHSIQPPGTNGRGSFRTFWHVSIIWLRRLKSMFRLVPPPAPLF